MPRTPKTIVTSADRETQALKRVLRAGVKAPQPAIDAWIRAVGAELILRSTLQEIRAVASAF
jgi:serine/threonine-protein kinase RIO1